MDCDGLNDWTRCSGCEHLCTPQCPIEGQDVVTNLARRLKILDSKGGGAVFVSGGGKNNNNTRGTHG